MRSVSGYRKQSLQLPEAHADLSFLWPSAQGWGAKGKCPEKFRQLDGNLQGDQSAERESNQVPGVVLEHQFRDAVGERWEIFALNHGRRRAVSWQINANVGPLRQKLPQFAPDCRVESITVNPEDLITGAGCRPANYTVPKLDKFG
jgi:hypothetical protein